jgi:hypothetical protein
VAVAVRIFDLTEPQSSRLESLETAPRRRDLRRTRRRYALVGVLSLAIPFFGALAVLGVAH